MSNRWTADDIARLGINRTKIKFANAEVIDGKKFITLPKKKRKTEESLQLQVCQYLKIKHPEIIFYSDIASGMKLTIGQAVKAKKLRSSRAQPDIFIAHPNSLYSGLFLELKKSHEEIYCKYGTLRRDEHLQEQAIMIVNLKRLGYMADFACGYEEAIGIITNYLKIK